MAPNVAIYSLFRDDGPSYIRRYFSQIHSQTHKNIKLHLVEGDSTIKPTYEYLQQSAYVWESNAVICKHDTKGARYGSVINDDRFRILAETANAALDSITEADYIMLLESDLLIEDKLVETLVNAAKGRVVAPLTMAGSNFYDVWAFRDLHGNQKGPNWNPKEEEQLASVGSVVMFPAKPILEGLRFDKRCIVGMCDDYRSLGYEVWAIPHKVRHPANQAEIQERGL